MKSWGEGKIFNIFSFSEPDKLWRKEDVNLELHYFDNS